MPVKPFWEYLGEFGEPAWTEFKQRIATSLASPGAQAAGRILQGAGEFTGILPAGRAIARGIEKLTAPSTPVKPTPIPTPAPKKSAAPKEKTLQDYLKSPTTWTTELLQKFYPYTAPAETAAPIPTPETILPPLPYGTEVAKETSERERRLFDEQMRVLTGLNAYLGPLMEKLNYYLEESPGRHKKKKYALLASALQTVLGIIPSVLGMAPVGLSREQQIKELEALSGLSLAPATRAKLLREAAEWKPTTYEEAMGLAEAQAQATTMPKVLQGLAGTLGNLQFMPADLRQRILGALEPVLPGISATGTTIAPTAKGEAKGAVVDRDTYVREAMKFGYSEKEAKEQYDTRIAPLIK